MKTRKIRILIHLAVLGLLIVSCSAEDGATGPAGPAGPQGEQGTAGADGADGTDGTNGEQGDQGDTGTANVIFSDWIDTEFAANIIATGAGFDIDVAELTQENINEAAILVYGRNFPGLSTPDIFPLPFITSSNQHNYRIQDVGVLRITIASIEGLSIGSPFFEDYRYVIIPGGNPAGGPGAGGGLGTKNGSVDYTKMSYKEITDHFGIE
ncbi:hypothetical protein [Allomuricauda sp. R78024]|uniref:hypothetical protein n=1 Tax=Allomuricauda sp. R78024 TaxID=3093867 RepID=UPI0037C6BA54